MFNSTLYLPRYLPAIKIACEIYPRTHQIRNGVWSPVTNVSRIRETRNHIIQNISQFSDVFDDAGRENLHKFKVWCDDEFTYLGNPRLTKEVNPMTSALQNSLASDLQPPYAPKDLQAIFYVLERSLVTLPIRINTPDEATIKEINRLCELCANVEMTQTHDTITLF